MSLTGNALNKFVESQIFFPDRDLVCTPTQVGLRFEDVWFTASDGIRLARLVCAGRAKWRRLAVLSR